MPIIPVTVSLGGRFVVTEALVDSGAARSIFDAQFARELGIVNVESGKRAHFEGVTGHRLTGSDKRKEIELMSGDRVG